MLFTADTPVNEGVRGTFGKSCAIKLQDQLMQAGGGKISVVDGDRLIKTFKGAGFTIKELGSGEALQAVSQKLGGLPVIARVQLRHRNRQVTSQHCSLVQTSSAELVGSVGGIAWLNESKWGMPGHSAALAQHERPAPGPNDQETLFARLDKQAQEPHPLSNAKFPYRINFVVNGKPVQGTFKNNEMGVPMKAGDQFEMIVENNTRDMIRMRLLVDGLNTLPELDTGTSGQSPSTPPSTPAAGSQVKGVETYLTAKPVKLDEARHWILDPRIKNGRFRIPGFSSKTGPDGEFRRLVVVDASESLAAKLGFKEQIGVVTAAFYQTVLPRNVGVVPGPAEPAYIPVLKDIRVGNPIAVLNIRYGEP